MKLYGPIILIDDDQDDLEIIEEVLNRNGVQSADIRTFTDCYAALKYLETTSEKPFLVICDINIPGMNGMEFRKIVDENEALRRKSIPFVFFSSAAIGMQVTAAYEMTVQGFFLKRNSLAEMEETIRRILDYWMYCVHPNSN
ncbi:MAG: response regulator [Chryseolinea sp.]